MQYYIVGSRYQLCVVAVVPKPCLSKTDWWKVLRNLKSNFVEGDVKSSLTCLNWSEKYVRGIICLYVSMMFETDST
jgi:hypothetical protein